ncbi:sulfite exporter TauE/SafE family protein [Microbacterium sp.]|uniref:sulfite exporter TauE/SafE family protein n=1 Tax=Microbacterium sp. TaxID=51671 RepID=UPI003C182ED2
MDWGLAVAALGIGIVVGLTGMGGGALMTPVLILFFGIPPLTAVSSDLITSAAMKPVGSAVHMRHGTVHWKIVLWLMIGSVPAAFSGALIIAAIGPSADVTAFVKTALGVVLLIASALLIVRAYIGLSEYARVRRGGTPTAHRDDVVKVRIIPTLIVGVVGGLMVGLTSVGSGSFIIITLMALYPALSANKLVGTDLAQAVPLVFAAALGHLLYGDVDWSVVLPLVVGSIPGAYIGARLSSRVAGGIVRRALALVLLVAGLKMLNVSNELTLAAFIAAFVLGTVGWMAVRARHGLTPTARQEKRARAAQPQEDL